MTENLFPFPETFNMYAILDHCREIQILTDHHRILKATQNTTQQDLDLLNQKLNGELADLYLLLENYFINRKGIIKTRRNKIKKYNK